MNPFPPKSSGPPGLVHVGQVVFHADGRARAFVWEGRRYEIQGDLGAQLTIGGVARRANLYLDPTTLELFDETRRRLGECTAPHTP